MHFLHKTYVFGLIILKRENERPNIVTLCRHFLVCDLRPWDTYCLYVTHFFSYLIVFQWLSRNFDAGQSLWTCFENWICSCLSIRRWGYTHSFKTKRVSFSVLLTNHDNKCASRIKLVAVECWIVCNTFVGIDMKTYNLDKKEIETKPQNKTHDANHNDSFGTKSKWTQHALIPRFQISLLEGARTYGRTHFRPWN